MPPLGGAGLADGVLVAEQAYYVEDIRAVNCMEPLHAHKIFGLFWTEPLLRLPKQLALPFRLLSSEAMSFTLESLLS